VVGVEVHLRAFLTLAPHGGEMSTSLSLRGASIASIHSGSNTGHYSFHLSFVQSGDGGLGHNTECLKRVHLFVNVTVRFI
jgi:hypothetical protein